MLYTLHLVGWPVRYTQLSQQKEIHPAHISTGHASTAQEDTGPSSSLLICRYFPVGMPCWNFVYSLHTDRGVLQLIFLSIPELFAWKGENQCVLVQTSYKLTSSISFDGGGRFFCCNRDVSYLLISFGCNSWLCHLAAITGGLHNLLKQFRASLLQITVTLMKEISLLQRRLLKDSAIRREEIRLEPQKLRHCRFGAQEKTANEIQKRPLFSSCHKAPWSPQKPIGESNKIDWLHTIKFPPPFLPPPKKKQKTRLLEKNNAWQLASSRDETKLFLPWINLQHPRASLLTTKTSAHNDSD